MAVEESTFELAGWRISSTKGPIATKSESEEICAKLGFPHPTMIFPHNKVAISKDEITIEVSALDAVYAVSPKSPEDIKVTYSKQEYWKEKQKQFRLELDYDWTYQSSYSGSVSGAAEIDTDESIDYEKLKPSSGQEVLFYNENVLFEDEMGDNGTSVFSVKIRAMSESIFMLVRSYIRVDGVIFKSQETRYLVDLPSGRILKEIRSKQDDYEDVLLRVGRTQYRNDPLIADQLSVTSLSTTEIL